MAIATADFNNDLAPDLAVVNADQTVDVVQNTSTVGGTTITFAAPQTVFTLAGVPVGIATGIRRPVPPSPPKTSP